MILRITAILGFVHRPGLRKLENYVSENWFCFRPQMKGWRRKFPKRRVLVLKSRTMNKFLYQSKLSVTHLHQNPSYPVKVWYFVNWNSDETDCKYCASGMLRCTGRQMFADVPSQMTANIYQTLRIILQRTLIFNNPASCYCHDINCYFLCSIQFVFTRSHIQYPVTLLCIICLFN